VKFDWEQFKLIFVRKKIPFLPIFGSLKSAKKLGLQIANPQIAKIYGPQIINPQIATFAEGPQIFKKIQVRIFADLRFAEHICGPPTFGNTTSQSETPHPYL
jgi:hypothetical protein